MKKLLSLALLASLGFSAKITLIPYGSYLHYTNSTKNHGYLGGIYSSFFTFPFKTEIDTEFTKLKYNYGMPDYYQRDLTLVEDYYFKDHYKIRAGIHNIFTSQGSSNHYQKVLFGGILYYQYLKYNAGLNYYYSTYEGFDVSQITPHIGFNFGNYYSYTGSFYASADINFINISNKNAAHTPQDNYVNGDVLLTNYQGRWATTIKASIGKYAYKVANGGFVVYNLGDEYHYSYGLNVSYDVNKRSAFKLGFTRSKFKENGKDGYSNVYVASYTLSF